MRLEGAVEIVSLNTTYYGFRCSLSFPWGRQIFSMWTMIQPMEGWRNFAAAYQAKLQISYNVRI